MTTKYTLIMDEVGKGRVDTQMMLVLEVSSLKEPKYLTDFVGGNACLHECGVETKYEICKASTTFRVILNNSSENNPTLVSATTQDKQSDPLIPLPIAQEQIFRFHFKDYHSGVDFKVRFCGV